MHNDKTVKVNDTTLNYSFTRDILLLGPDPHENQVKCLAILTKPNRIKCVKETLYLNFYFTIMIYKCAKKDLHSLEKVMINHNENQDLYFVIAPEYFNLKNIHAALMEQFKKELEA